MPRPNLAEYTSNFETLRRALDNGHTAIVEAFDVRTDQRAVIVVAMQANPDEIQMIPLAQLLDGNPYAYLASPDPESGGYLAPDGSVITQQQADHAESADSPEEAQRQQRRAEILADLEAQNGRSARKPFDPEPLAYFALVVDDGETHTEQTTATKQEAEAHIIDAANDIRDRLTGHTHAEITTYDAAFEYLDTYGAYVRIFEIS